MAKELPGVIATLRTLGGSLDGSLLSRRDSEGRRDRLEGSEASQHVDKGLTQKLRQSPLCLLEKKNEKKKGGVARKVGGATFIRSMTSPQYKELLVEDADGILKATFNRPKRKNAMNPDLYLDLINVLRQARRSEHVRVLMLTGAGDYYSSGNDLTNFTTVDMSDTESVQKLMKDSKRMLEELVEEFIIFPKILIAVVNGPAIGVGCTHLALCDFVYTVDRYAMPLLKACRRSFRSRTPDRTKTCSVRGSILLSSA